MTGRASEVLEAITALSAVATLPLGILAFVFLGWPIGVAIFVVGWLLLVPVFGILASALEPATDGAVTEHAPSQRAAGDDALETLRERYARGEIGEDEFERRVDELLETDPSEPASRVSDPERTTEELERE